jgi:Polyketide cyclase / dehydrase and lipid transport
MATIIRDVTIDTEPATAWEALRDFGALHQRLARGFVADCQMVAEDRRLITFFNGAVAQEQLIGVDDDSRRLAYAVVESSFNLTHHNAAAQIAEDGTGRTRFTWIVDVLPDEVAALITDMMVTGLAAIAATLDPTQGVSGQPSHRDAVPPRTISTSSGNQRST